MFSPRLPHGEFFRCTVPEVYVTHWAGSTKKSQLIGQAEIMPILISKLTWCAVLCHCRVLYFVDNDSARQAAIKMSSPVAVSADILWAISFLNAEYRCLDWYARVSSAGNMGDTPSRLCVPSFRGRELTEAKAVFPAGAVMAACLGQL